MSNQVSKSFLLLVEDSDEDFTAFLRFSKSFIVENPIKRCRNGEEALQFLEETANTTNNQKPSFPSLIVLDLNLPGIDGREILIRITENTQWEYIPTIIFSSSHDPRDIEFCYKHGAKSYILKPMDIEQLKKTIHILWEYWFHVVILPSYYNL